jgi:hypothetical protein
VGFIKITISCFYKHWVSLFHNSAGRQLLLKKVDFQADMDLMFSLIERIIRGKRASRL